MRDLIQDWEFNVIGVDNYRKAGRLTAYYTFLIENHATIPGDVCEVGVYRGASLLATAMLLKELGSAKRVWGFDTFSGFPSFHDQDRLEKFDELYRSGAIDAELYQQVKLNQAYRALNLQAPITAANISTSGAFAETSLELVQRKIEFLDLDNIVLVPGAFAETMRESEREYPEFCAALIDCDLYESYVTSLPFVWQRLAFGGYMFLDEYYSLKFPGARIATDNFFANKRDKPQMHRPIPGEFQRWFVRKLFAA